MNAQLRELADTLEAVTVRARSLRAGLPADAWTQRPGEGQWSPAECIAHLNLSSEALLPVLRSALDEASVKGAWRGRTASTYRRDLAGWFVWHLLSPSSPVRTRSAAAFEPQMDGSTDNVLCRFEQLQHEVLACVQAADGLSIDRIRVASPFCVGVTYNLYSALTLVARHQERHLLQAERAARVAAGEALLPDVTPVPA
jgi:hypothetical protein